MSKLQRLSAAVDNFISKSKRINEPLEAFRKTDSFKELNGSLQGGILQQVKDLMSNLPGWIITLQTFDEGRVDNWIRENQKPINNYVSNEKTLQALIDAFIYSIKATYNRHGVSIKKATKYSVNFDLTNSYYLDALADQANYLLNLSSIDDTTRTRLIGLIKETRGAMMTLEEVTEAIVSEFENISETRAFIIANTEANQAMSTAQHAFLVENGIKTKKWIPAGPSTCDICEGNADDGEISTNDSFSSGDDQPPAHPNCECYLDGGEIDLDSVDVLWDGS